MAVSPRSERRTMWHSHIADEHGPELRAIMPLLLLGVPGIALGRVVGGGSVDPAGGDSYTQGPKLHPVDIGERYPVDACEIRRLFFVAGRKAPQLRQCSAHVRDCANEESGKRNGNVSNNYLAPQIDRKFPELN